MKPGSTGAGRRLAEPPGCLPAGAGGAPGRAGRGEEGDPAGRADGRARPARGRVHRVRRDVRHPGPDRRRLGFGPSRMLGGLAFSLGLILVVVGGAELFTGNNLIVMAWAEGKVTSSQLLRNWRLVYLANIAGAFGSVCSSTGRARSRSAAAASARPPSGSPRPRSRSASPRPSSAASCATSWSASRCGCASPRTT